jgi:2-dehydro-3-deoxygluconokinase
MVRVLSIGEVMLEMSDIGDGLYKKSFAGDTFNVAHYLSVVSGGQFKADYLTAVGTDADSQACLEFLRRHGVPTDQCQQDPERNIGLFILSNDASGEKQYGYWRGQSAARHLFDKPRDLSGYDLIYLSGITAAITENKTQLVNDIKTARQNGARIAFDFNYRALLWSPEEAVAFCDLFLPYANIIKISDEELENLLPDSDLASLSKTYPSAEWVLTCGGDKGEVWMNGEMVAQQLFASVPTVVDSSAAGDAFIATYLAAQFSGCDALTALNRGHAVASQVVCAKGSIVPIDLTKLD